MGQTLFYVFAATAVIAAFGVVFNKNVVHSALWLLVNFCVLAMLYVTLNAQFLAVVQLLIYAGAVVVLFLFVVMLLGAELGEKVSSWFTARNAFLAALGLVLLTLIGTVVFENPFVYQTGGKTGNLPLDMSSASARGMFLMPTKATYE